MIVVHVRIQSSADDIQAIRSAILAMEEKSRDEPGCHDYTFSVELSDPQVLRITERWEDMQALDAHFKSEHMANFREAVAAHPPRDMKVRYFRAEEFSPPPG